MFNPYSSNFKYKLSTALFRKCLAMPIMSMIYCNSLGNYSELRSG